MAQDALHGLEVSVTQKGHETQSCLHCEAVYVPKKRGQRFCSVKCRVAHFRNDAPPKPVKIAVPHKAREPRDGMRCRTCLDFIDSREGWRLDCKSCSRKKMLALHNPNRCTRHGCIICMNATLAQSAQFLAAWDSENSELGG